MPCTLIYAALVVPLTENCSFHGLTENLVAVTVRDSVRRLGLKLLLHLGGYLGTTEICPHFVLIFHMTTNINLL